MDGQRRIAQPVKRLHRARGDCPLAYRAAARCSAVMLLGFALMHGIVQGGHLDYHGSPWSKLSGRIASMMGLAADDIEISGLEQHDPRLVLDAIGVRPGVSLAWFNPAHARARLESLDWVRDAHVRRVFPNRLIISVTEREAFAIWQKNGQQFVIDREGVPMSGFNPAGLRGVLVVSGDAANAAAQELINQLEAVPELREKVRAASRVGMRRWNLYLANGTKILLPSDRVESALVQAVQLDRSHGLLAGGVAELDLRTAGQVRIAVAPPTVDGDVTTSSIAPQ